MASWYHQGRVGGEVQARPLLNFWHFTYANVLLRENRTCLMGVLSLAACATLSLILLAARTASLLPGSSCDNAQQQRNVTKNTSK